MENKPQRIINAIKEHGEQNDEFLFIDELKLIESINEDDFYQYLDQDLTKVKKILPKTVFRKNGKVFVNKRLLENNETDFLVSMEHQASKMAINANKEANFKYYVISSFFVFLLGCLLGYLYGLNFAEVNIILDTETLKLLQI